MRVFSQAALLALCCIAFEAKVAHGLDTDALVDQILNSDSGSDAATGAIVDNAAKSLGIDNVDSILGDDAPVKDDNPYKGLFGDDDDDDDDKKKDNSTSSTVGASYTPMPSTSAGSTATTASAPGPTVIGPTVTFDDNRNQTRPGRNGFNIVTQTSTGSACEATGGAHPTGRYTSTKNETCLGGKFGPANGTNLLTSSSLASNSSLSPTALHALNSSQASNTSILDTFATKGYNSTATGTHGKDGKDGKDGSPTSTGKGPSPSTKLPGLFDSGANGHLIYQEAGGVVYALVMVVIGAVVFL
ncbi:hypothetical protein C1H76_4442 [Elsinoe australis]|uniref:Uncharacterized protein n=1 Tax=Elsinoe australis TaxID=40998 RepID=A0A4U7B5I4_9PEZI|nr:hypothetical protein C1H76_4442 [Elsinoe australis]